MNYDEYDEYEEKEERKSKSNWMKSFQNIFRGDEEEDYYEDEEEYEERPNKTIHIWHEIKSLEDAKSIIDNLKHGDEQIVNFETTEDDLENDIRYFLYGAVYSLGGSVDEIAKDSILIAPKGVSIEKPDTKIKKPSFVSAFRVNG